MNSTVLVALILIGAVTLAISFFVFISRKQMREHRERLRQGFLALLTQHGLVATEEQELPHRILGIDMHHRVFVAFNPAAEDAHAVVPLADVVGCSVRKEGVSFHQGRRDGKRVTEEHINGISLSLRLKNGTAVDVPVWSEALDGVEEKIRLHNVAVTWQGRIKSALESVEAKSRMAAA